ncbi:MAG: hypothetical protein ACQESF_04975, partial [Nanobdellota archaeon]
MNIKKMVFLCLVCSFILGCSLDKCDEASCNSNGLQCNPKFEPYKLSDEEIVLGFEYDVNGQGNHDMGISYLYKTNNGFQEIRKKSTSISAADSCYVERQEISELGELTDSYGYGDPIGEWKAVFSGSNFEEEVSFFIVECYKGESFTDSCIDTETGCSGKKTKSCSDGRWGDWSSCKFSESQLSRYYKDNDGDDYGNELEYIEACEAPSGYVPNSDDCNDDNGKINLGVDEVCDNGIDDNCNGLIDCEDPDCSDDDVCETEDEQENEDD